MKAIVTPKAARSPKVAITRISETNSEPKPKAVVRLVKKQGFITRVNAETTACRLSIDSAKCRYSE